MKNKHINEKDSNGLRTGVWVGYHGNGNIACQDTYKEGVLNGLSKIWINHGKISWYENFVMGVNEGEVIGIEILEK
jgi:antitoxin component YwqK of YwqJK toxin-antitoxin module